MSRLIGDRDGFYVYEGVFLGFEPYICIEIDDKHKTYTQLRKEIIEATKRKFTKKQLENFHDIMKLVIERNGRLPTNKARIWWYEKGYKDISFSEYKEIESRILKRNGIQIKDFIDGYFPKLGRIKFSAIEPIRDYSIKDKKQWAIYCDPGTICDAVISLCRAHIRAYKKTKDAFEIQWTDNADSDVAPKTRL